MVAWSWSVLESFETCAHRHFRTKVKKDIVEGQTDEMAHGNRVHKALENRLKGQPLPANMAAYEPYAARVLQSGTGGKVEAEQKLALTSSFQPTSFFAKDTWVRVITDFTIIQPAKKRAFVGDWKTGNPKPNSRQLALCAVATFACLPYVDEVHSTYVWLKTGEGQPEVFKREDVPAIWQSFMPRVQRLEIAHAENKWPKKPSGLCNGWCPVKDCEFWGPGRR